MNAQDQSSHLALCDFQCSLSVCEIAGAAVRMINITKFIPVGALVGVCVCVKGCL